MSLRDLPDRGSFWRRLSIIPAELNPERLNLVNIIYRYPRRLFHTFISALGYVLAYTLFYAKAAVISTGIAGIAQIIIYANPTLLLPYFSLLILALNLPLFIIFSRLLPTRFLILTLYWLIFQVIIQTTFNITHFSDILSRLSIYNIAAHTPWDVANPLHHATWPIFVYGIIGAVMAVSSSAWAWKHGGSSAGIDIVVNYILQRLKTSVGRINVIVALVCLGLSVISVLLIDITYDSFDYPKFISRFTTTTINILLSGFIFDIIYPKYRKVLIKVFSHNNIHAVVAALQQNNYWHSYNMIQYSTKYRDDYYLETSCLYLELEEILRIIRLADPNAFITIQPVVNVIGRFDTKRVE